jgi:hypothetical protein
MTTHQEGDVEATGNSEDPPTIRSERRLLWVVAVAIAAIGALGAVLPDRRRQ